MSDNEGTAPPGWLHAQGDPPGTHRYWDGTAWQGEPVPIAPAPAPEEVVPPPPAMPPPSLPSEPLPSEPMSSEPLPSAVPPSTFDSPPAFAPPAQSGSTFTPTTFAEASSAASEPKSSKWKWAIGIVALLAVGIGGCTYWFVQAVSGPIDVGNEYLAAIEAQDFDAAWALTDESCFAIGDASALAAVFAEIPVTGYSLKTSNVTSTNGDTSGTTTGTVTVNGDDDRSIQILASKPDDEWRICGFDIGDPGSG